MTADSEKVNIGMAYERLAEALQKPKYTPGRIKKTPTRISKMAKLLFYTKSLMGDIKMERSQDELEHFQYVIYARKSSEEEEAQINSIDDQVRLCREYADRHNLDVLKVITEENPSSMPTTVPNLPHY